MDEAATIASLEARVAQLEALVHRLTASSPEPVVPTPTRTPAATSTDDDPMVRPVTDTAPAPAEADGPPAQLDRRRLLGRAGTAAVGAVLGGTAAGIAAASPAAAATGTFDTSTSTPALTATSTSTGPAVLASATGSGPAVDARGRIVVTDEGSGTPFVGSVEVESAGSTGMSVVAHSGTGLFVDGKLGAVFKGFGMGAVFYGLGAQLALAQLPGVTMAPPPGHTSEHDAGEIYFDANGTLWVCGASGTPGNWTRIGGAGTAGAFTVLPTPTRAYDTRPGSGLPGAGTGPVTGIRKNIDLTANNSGLPTDATAAMVTLTATNTQPNAQAYGQIYANNLTTPPGTSTINWTAANDLVATTTTTALTNGKVTITMNPAANVLIDVIGYWR